MYIYHMNTILPKVITPGATKQAGHSHYGIDG